MRKTAAFGDATSTVPESSNKVRVVTAESRTVTDSFEGGVAKRLAVSSLFAHAITMESTWPRACSAGAAGFKFAVKTLTSTLSSLPPNKASGAFNAILSSVPSAATKLLIGIPPSGRVSPGSGMVVLATAASNESVESENCVPGGNSFNRSAARLNTAASSSPLEVAAVRSAIANARGRSGGGDGGGGFCGLGLCGGGESSRHRKLMPSCCGRCRKRSQSDSVEAS
mmetsp:Transcript_56052/g.148870  ORF Transcript_56052/g.148870 Transcript_56052/m.148870 type:complete len:226 (+) Transcript_56052:1760-2437(+)